MNLIAEYLKTHKTTIIADYEAGMSKENIAKKHGMSVSPITRCFREWGIKIRTPGGQRRREVRNRMELYKDEIITAYKGGVNTIILATKYGVSHSTIHNYFQYWNVECRSAGKRRDSLYVFKCVHKKVPYIVYKIGVSDYPQKRRRTVEKNAICYRILIAKKWNGCADKERAIHRKLKPYQIEKEYFEPNPALDMLISGEVDIEDFLALNLDELDKPQQELPLFAAD